MEYNIFVRKKQKINKPSSDTNEESNETHNLQDL